MKKSAKVKKLTRIQKLKDFNYKYNPLSDPMFGTFVFFASGILILHFFFGIL